MNTQSFIIPSGVPGGVPIAHLGAISQNALPAIDKLGDKPRDSTGDRTDHKIYGIIWDMCNCITNNIVICESNKLTLCSRVTLSC